MTLQINFLFADVSYAKEYLGLAKQSLIGSDNETLLIRGITGTNDSKLDGYIKQCLVDAFPKTFSPDSEKAGDEAAQVRKADGELVTGMRHMYPTLTGETLTHDNGCALEEEFKCPTGATYPAGTICYHRQTNQGELFIIYPSLTLNKSNWKLKYAPVLAPARPKPKTVNGLRPAENILGDGTTTGVDAALTMATFLGFGIGGPTGIAIAAVAATVEAIFNGLMGHSQVSLIPEISGVIKKEIDENDLNTDLTNLDAYSSWFAKYYDQSWSKTLSMPIPGDPAKGGGDELFQTFFKYLSEAVNDPSKPLLQTMSALEEATHSGDGTVQWQVKALSTYMFGANLHLNMLKVMILIDSLPKYKLDSQFIPIFVSSADEYIKHIQAVCDYIDNQITTRVAKVEIHDTSFTSGGGEGVPITTYSTSLFDHGPAQAGISDLPQTSPYSAKSKKSVFDPSSDDVDEIWSIPYEDPNFCPFCSSAGTAQTAAAQAQMASYIGNWGAIKAYKGSAKGGTQPAPTGRVTPRQLGIFYYTQRDKIQDTLATMTAARDLFKSYIKPGQKVDVSLLQSHHKTGKQLVDFLNTVQTPEAIDEAFETEGKDVGVKTGQAILKHREENGPFGHTRAIDQVPGVGPKRLNTMFDVAQKKGLPPATSLTLPPWAKTIMFRPRITGLTKQFLRNNMGKLLPGHRFSPVDAAAGKEYQQLMKKLLGANTPGDMTKSILDRITDKDPGAPGAWAKDLRNCLDPIISSSGRSMFSKYGNNPADWPLEARQIAWGVREQLGTGHNDVVISFEPKANAAELVADLRLMRCVMGSFPGQSAQLTPEQYTEIMTAGRDLEGVPIKKILQDIPEIAKQNADWFRTSAPIEGPVSLGWSSYVEALMHYQGDGMQMVNMATKLKHALDGVAPWVAIEHPDFPGCVIYVSVHLGESALPLQDPANSGMCTGTFKVLFRRGDMLYEHFKKLADQFGEDVAMELLLNPQNAKSFRDFVYSVDPLLTIDTSIISVMDGTMGEAAASMGVFSGPNVQIGDMTVNGSAPDTIVDVNVDDWSALSDSKSLKDDILNMQQTGVKDSVLVKELDKGAVNIETGGNLTGLLTSRNHSS